MTREAHRRFARYTFGGLLLLHLAAFGVYLLNENQFGFLGHWREGREAWRAGQLEVAARELRTFTEGYRYASLPFLVRRDFPGEAQAWAALGRVEQARGELPAAVDAFGRAAQLGQEAAWRERHELLWKLQDASGLEAQGQQRLRSGSPEAWQDLAAAATLRGNTPAALAHYAAALQALPGWLDRQQRARSAADGGLVDEQLALYLLAGATAWLAGDNTQGRHYCGLLARAQDAENPMDGLCRAAAALERGDAAETLSVLAATGVAGAEQATFAAELRSRASRLAPIPQSASPSPARAVHPRR